jgi:hypothetical protein
MILMKKMIINAVSAILLAPLAFFIMHPNSAMAGYHCACNQGCGDNSTSGRLCEWAHTKYVEVGVGMPELQGGFDSKGFVIPIAGGLNACLSGGFDLYKFIEQNGLKHIQFIHEGLGGRCYYYKAGNESGKGGEHMWTWQEK